MRIFYLLTCILLMQHTVIAQTLVVSGQCMTGTITLNPVGEEVNGKIAYQSTGTVDGITGVTVNVYWLGDPANVWVLDYDGQPYFQNNCNTVLPPSNPNNACAWTTVEGTSCEGETALTITGSGVLAVRLLSFTVTNSGKEVLLAWKTASESNNKEFDVERSTNGTVWQRIATVPGKINSAVTTQYSYTDKFPVYGKNYYRLLQKDFDGKITYSGIQSAEILTDKLFQVYNTNARGKYQVMLQSDEAAEITVQDISGKKLWSIRAAKGSHPLDLSAYPAGIYLLRIKWNNESYTQKLINP